MKDALTRIKAKMGCMPFARTGAIILCFGLGWMPNAAAGDYHLGVMDTLRIRVAEWQTAEGAVRDWSVVSGDYSVGASGDISLPLIGELAATGKTTAEIAQAIGIALQKQVGLRDRPSASVEIAKYRPFYLIGKVQTPGEYPYMPNLTVMKAVSLSGGFRQADPGQRFARDFINAKSDAIIFIAERNRLLSRKARLAAEISGFDHIEMPIELKNVPAASSIMASEQTIMQSRSKQLTLQLQALDDLKGLLQSEVISLSKKGETQTGQLLLAKEDREKVKDLAEKGLALSARKLAAEQRAADLEAALLDIDTASLKAKQDISKADQDEITLRNDRANELAREMQGTDAQLEELELKLASSQTLMEEASVQSADAAQAASYGQDVTVTYSIVRSDSGKPIEIPAEENTEVLPGDVVKVSAGLTR